MEQSNAIKKIGLVLGVIILGIFVIVQIITARGNTMAQFYMYLAVGALLFGLFYPKNAIYVSLFTTCYIDFFKRLMILDAGATPKDLYYVLGIPPLLVGGALVTAVLSLIMGRRRIPREMIYGGICIMLFFGLAAIAAGGLSGGGTRGLGDVVNTGLYSCFFMLIPYYFPTAEDKKKLLKVVLIIFIPVALYMFRHRYLGLAQFEYDYLLSGLTIEVRVLYDQEALRGFSTMNGAAVVSTFLSMMVLLVMVPLVPAGQYISPMNRVLRIGIACLFIIASYFTVSRAGWISGIAAILVYVFLQKRFTAVLGTFLAVSSVLLMIFSAPLLLKYNVMQEIEKVLQEVVLGSSTGDAFSKRAIVLGTMNARLEGWVNLTQKPELYTPFGFKFAGQKVGSDGFYWGHDLIVDTLIQVGYIPVLIMIALAGYGLYLIYRFYFGLEKGSLEQKVLRLSFCFVVGILIGGLSNGAQLRVWPQNYYFFLFLAMIFSAYMNQKRVTRTALNPGYQGLPALQNS